MQITPAALRALNTQFSGLFQRGYAAAGPMYQQLATMVPSTTKSNTYGWMERIPRLREWIGERLVNNLAAHAYSIENKRFEDTLEVDRDDFEDDNLGVYAPLAEMLGQAAATYPDDVLISLLQNGESNACFDGQNFFDTDHPINKFDDASGVQSNYWASGLALTQPNFFTMRQQFQSWKGADGRSLKARLTHLVVPPALEDEARTILEAEMIAAAAGQGGAVSNISRNLAQLIVWDELSGDDTTWYGLDLSKPIKPFVWQDRRRPRFQQKMDDNDDNVFYRNKYVWGVDARGNGGYSLWFLGAKARA